jgi:polyhydroxyalkanoate synthesis regulator phasin
MQDLDKVAFTAMVLLARQKLDRIVSQMVKQGVAESEARHFLAEVVKEALKK